MKSIQELLIAPVYWIEVTQNKIFNMVRTHMERKGMNQSQLASELGVTKGYISQILNGNFNFSIQKLIELSLKLGVAPVLQFEDLEVYIAEEVAKRKELEGANIIPMNSSINHRQENEGRLKLNENILGSNIEEVIMSEDYSDHGLIRFSGHELFG